MARVVILEPSKVGSQHITLLEGHLRALAALGVVEAGHRLVYVADPSSHAALSAELRGKIEFEPIKVINPEERRFVAKGFQEAGAVVAQVRKMAPEDILVVCCITSPALIMLEALARVLARRRVVVILHGEIEGIFDPSIRQMRSFGFWAHLWSKVRFRGSPIGLAVIADFIRDALCKERPGVFHKEDIAILPFPVTPYSGEGAADGPHHVSFIGYRMGFKGFGVFERLAASLSGPDLIFEAVGGGIAETLPGGAKSPLIGTDGFLAAVARASVAVFPYEGGYVAGLSAAALDAIATGVHIVASRRPCFEAIETQLGPDAITICDSEEAMCALLADRSFLDRARAGAARRRAMLPSTVYGDAASQEGFRRLLGSHGIKVAPAKSANDRVPA